MKTYITTVYVGTAVQIIVSANDEDHAETIAIQEVTNKLLKPKSKIYKDIKVIEAEVNEKIADTPLFEINKE